MLDVFECRHHNHTDTILADCRRCVDYRPVPSAMTRADRITLHLSSGAGTSPGDVLVMTAAVESLHAAHPGRYLTAVSTSCDVLFEHNPRVSRFDDGLPSRGVRMQYNLIHQSNQRPVHFMQGFCDHLAEALGVQVPLAVNRPQLYLSREERSWVSQVEEVTGRPTRFWLVNAGTKKDFTAKGWGRHNYQRVVDLLRGKVLFAQVGAYEHDHEPLDGALNLVGWTDLRQLVRLAYHCAGGLGPSTLLQHLCAAWEKPYVCLVGGREPTSWVHYPKQTTLSSVGVLKCCEGGACWRSRTVALGDGAEQDKSLCELPVLTGPEPVPSCLAQFTPEEVARAIMRYEHGVST